MNRAREKFKIIIHITMGFFCTTELIHVTGKPYVPASYTVPAPRSPSPQAKDSPAKGKGKDKGKAATVATPEPAQDAVSV